MRSAAKRKIDRRGPIASALAASEAVLPEAEIGPSVRPVASDTIATMIGEPSWSSIGRYARLAFVILESRAKGADVEALIAEMLEEKEGEPYEDTLVMMSRTRVAIADIAAMMKESVSLQWRAVDAYLVASGLPALEVDDDLCDDAELLALRPIFEAGRAAMKAATAEVAVAEAQCKPRSARREAAYAAQAAAIDQDNAIVDQVTALRAHTKRGIQFKREVRAHWQGCEQLDLDRSINADLLAYVEASP